VPADRRQQPLEGPTDRRHRDHRLRLPFFPAWPGTAPLAAAPTLGTRRPASPGRRGDETHATSGPRNDSGPILPSSVGSPAPPATGSSRAAPPGAGGCPPASSRRHIGSHRRRVPRSKARSARPRRSRHAPSPEPARRGPRRTSPPTSPWSPRARSPCGGAGDRPRIPSSPAAGRPRPDGDCSAVGHPMWARARPNAAPR
jgi:hypothetical protein